MADNVTPLTSRGRTTADRENSTSPTQSDPIEDRMLVMKRAVKAMFDEWLALHFPELDNNRLNLELMEALNTTEACARTEEFFSMFNARARSFIATEQAELEERRRREAEATRQQHAIPPVPPTGDPDDSDDDGSLRVMSFDSDPEESTEPSGHSEPSPAQPSSNQKSRLGRFLSRILSDSTSEEE